FEMRLTPAEVYEVASFYHHFDVVKEGEAAPPRLTVRVCESISCALAGGERLLEELKRRAGPDVRVIPAPCIRQCDRAPAAVVGRNPIGAATASAIDEAVAAGATEPALPDYVQLAEYRARGGYQILAGCVEGRRTPEDVIAAVEAAGLRGLGGAGFPTARKWGFVRAEPGPRVV